MNVYQIANGSKDKYQLVPYSAADNPWLSLDAVGLLCRLLADGEKFESIRDLVEYGGRDDFDVVEEAARELEAEGYLRRGERTEVWAVPFGWEAS